MARSAAFRLLPETDSITGGGTATLHLLMSAEGPNWVVVGATDQFEHVKTNTAPSAR